MEDAHEPASALVSNAKVFTRGFNEEKATPCGLG